MEKKEANKEPFNRPDGVEVKKCTAKSDPTNKEDFCFSSFTEATCSFLRTTR